MAGNEIWITGIGLISSLGEGADAHWQVMAEGAERPTVIDATRFAPFPVYPMVPLELDKQIPRRADQRQMASRTSSTSSRRPPRAARCA